MIAGWGARAAGGASEADVELRENSAGALGAGLSVQHAVAAQPVMLAHLCAQVRGSVLADAVEPQQPRTAREFRQLAETAARSFKEQFWDQERRCLFDVLAPAGTGWAPVATPMLDLLL